MTSRERVLRTLKYQETDRVPFGIMGTNAPAEQRMAKELKCSCVEELYRLLDLDIWHLSQPLKYKGENRVYKGRPADFWGVPLDISSQGDTGMDHPLAEVSSVDEVEAYVFPKIEDFDASWLDRTLDEHGEFAIEGGLWAPIFHNMTWLCGFETTLMNLAEEPEISKALLRRITDFWVDYARMVLETARGRILIMQNCNDFGTQRDLLISRSMFCEFFKPELKRLYDVIKEYDVAVLQHSCGAVSEIYDDFIESGVDIMNPVQVSAAGMDIPTISRRFGGRVVLYGGIDTQHVLPEGPEERIRGAVREALDCFRDCKGYILGPSQGIEADIPTEHVRILFDEAIKYYRK